MMELQYDAFVPEKGRIAVGVAADGKCRFFVKDIAEAGESGGTGPAAPACTVTIFP